MNAPTPDPVMRLVPLPDPIDADPTPDVETITRYARQESAAATAEAMLAYALKDVDLGAFDAEVVDFLCTLDPARLATVASLIHRARTVSGAAGRKKLMRARATWRGRAQRYGDALMAVTDGDPTGDYQAAVEAARVELVELRAGGAL